MSSIKFIMIHKKNITSKGTQEYMEFWSLFIVHGRQQSSRLQSAPTDKKSTNSETGPSLVSLAPTKNGLRSPILKCKSILASLMLISDCHQSAAHQHCSSSTNQLCSSLLLVIGLLIWFIFSMLLITVSHHCCSSTLLVTINSSTSRSNWPCL